VITPAYVRCLAAYNSEMNRKVYAAAARLSDAVRREDGGLFWGSIHSTLNHLLWADTMWMSRLDGWDRPARTLIDSGRLIPDFADLMASRFVADARIEAFAQRQTEADISASMTWFSGAAQREVTAPRALLLVHFFNHQTHHRGQVHALLTRSGQDIGDTDLFLVLPEDMLAAI